MMKNYGSYKKMTNRDFDQDDAEVLAEFAGLSYIKVDEVPSEEKTTRLRNTEAHYVDMMKGHPWQPWSLEAPMWQIQSLLDAVREKGLVGEFRDTFIEQHEKDEFTISSMDFMEAPPEAICSVILAMEKTK